MSQTFVIIEMKADGPSSIAEKTFAVAPRTGDFILVQPEGEEPGAVTFEVIAVVLSPNQSGIDIPGDLFVGRVGQSADQWNAIEKRFAAWLASRT